MAAYYSDLHCHTVLFNYNRLFENAWSERLNLFFPVQGDFTSIAKGRARVIMLALYPVEQGFVTVKPWNLGTGDITDFLARVIMDMPKERTDAIQRWDHDYFEDLLEEIGYVSDSADPVRHRIRIQPGKKMEFTYRIMSGFDDLKQFLNLDDHLNPGSEAENRIAVVLTIEGGNALGFGQHNTIGMNQEQLETRLADHIDRLKRLGPPDEPGAWCPFFITLCHHFWNQLGGHSVSLYDAIRKVMDQTPGINNKITRLGQLAVEQLLSVEGGRRRILIDIVHMSPAVRRWYYKYLQERGDQIPVIASHSGVNGFKTLDEAEMKQPPASIHDYADRIYEASNGFNPWDGLLSYQEIMIIHRSRGIIGLNLDQRIMMGKGKLEKIRKQARLRSEKVSETIWIRPLADQIMHIAEVILLETGDPNGIWDNISIGSDFNGMITPLRAFRNATKFPDLDEAIYHELINRRDTAVLSGKSDQQIRIIADAIVWRNNLSFLERNYR